MTLTKINYLLFSGKKCRCAPKCAKSGVKNIFSPKITKYSPICDLYPEKIFFKKQNSINLILPAIRVVGFLFDPQKKRPPQMDGFILVASHFPCGGWSPPPSLSPPQLAMSVKGGHLIIWQLTRFFFGFLQACNIQKFSTGKDFSNALMDGRWW